MTKPISDQRRKEVGVYLAQVREYEGLTQAQAAKRAGITSPVYISLIETGKRMPSRKTLAKLARAYHHTSLNEMLEYAGYPTDIVPLGAESSLVTNSIKERQEVPLKRLQWALECIRLDPDYNLEITDRTGSHEVNLLAATILLYQEFSGRQLLTALEKKSLEAMIRQAVD